MTTFRDREMSAAASAEHAALLRAAAQTGRTVGDGTPELNSALQILGDSLTTMKDDSQALLGEAPRVSGVAESIDDAGPILVEAELRAVVALTRDHWKNRLNVFVEIASSLPQFWCRWWIVRIAAMRMVMLAAESQRRAPSNANAKHLPGLRLTGRLNGARFELQMQLDQAPDQSAFASVDSVLALCAKALSGAIEMISAKAGGTLTFSCPVRLSPTGSDLG